MKAHGYLLRQGVRWKASFRRHGRVVDVPSAQPNRNAMLCAELWIMVACILVTVTSSSGRAEGVDKLLEMLGRSPTRAQVSFGTCPANQTVLCMNDPSDSDREWEFIEQMRGQDHLWLDSSDVTDDHLRHLRKMEGVRHLHLTDTRVSDKGMAHVAQLASLRYLSISHTRVTDDSLSLLAKLPNLEGLSASHTPIRSIHVDGDFPSLKWLDLPDGLHDVHLANLPRITKLDLALDDQPEPRLVHLEDLPALERLKIDSFVLHFEDGQGIRFTLRRLPRLSEFLLYEVRVSADDLIALRDFKNLTWLRLIQCRFDGRPEPHLGELRQLKRLNVRNSFLDPAGMDFLENLSQLEDLNLAAFNIDGRALVHVRALTKLRTLDFSGNRPVREEDSQHLSNLTALTELTLASCGVSDDALRALAPLRALQYLSLSGNREITDDGLEHLAHLENLEELGLSACSVRGPGLRHLVGLPKLRVLILSNYAPGYFESDAIEHLAAMKSLRRLTLSTPLDPGRAVPQLKKLTFLEELRLRREVFSKQQIRELRDVLERKHGVRMLVR